MTPYRTFKVSDSIRVVCYPEEENYFSVYGKPDSKEEYDEIVRTIDRSGLWYVVSEFKCPCCGSWVHADSIGMIIADNPFNETDNPYMPDLISAARAALEEKTQTV